jgi:hypothetical protein
MGRPLEADGAGCSVEGDQRTVAWLHQCETTGKRLARLSEIVAAGRV